ncbi:hypothetical protein BGZ75_003172 [Mortierella antarctica]|nr:hypothetical protein BGZ67_000330 [Mortierella alpina]KAF9985300.1 hypothetical protein BGZ75_003172 [Mortierella antarctica]
MKFAAIALSTIALASQASAVIIAYSQPISATQWTAGQEATVAWTNKCSDITGNTTFPITLNEEINTYQVEVPGVGPIGYLDCKRSGSTKVKIPATLPQGNKYSILVVNGGNQSYSALFTILSTVPGPTPSAVSSALPTASTAAATASSSVPSAAVSTAAPTPTRTSDAGALKAGSYAVLAAVAAIGAMAL